MKDDTYITVDTRGQKCPMPILNAKKALMNLAPGEVLQVLATDPGSVRDFQAYAKQTGHLLLSHTQTGTDFIFFLKHR